MIYRYIYVPVSSTDVLKMYLIPWYSSGYGLREIISEKVPI